MKKPLIIHNPHDCRSTAFINWLDEQDIDYCLLNWETPCGTSRNHEKALDEVFRLIEMHRTGAMEGLAPPEPEIEYTDEDIENSTYTEQNDRWIMTCECHKGEGYEGPPLRAFPAVILELPNGELGMWDLLLPVDQGLVESITPEEMWDRVKQPELMSVSVKRGECLGGQWFSGLQVTANDPYWSNHIIRTSVRNFIKKYFTIDLREPDKELVPVSVESPMVLKELELK